MERSISYYTDLSETEGMVIFGYFFNDYFVMENEKDILIDKVFNFCKRNNKSVDYSIYVNDYSQYELQIKVMSNA